MGDAFLAATAIISLIALFLLIARPKWGLFALFLVRPLVDATWSQSLVGDFKLTEIVSSLVPIIVIGRIVLVDGREGTFARMPLKWLWVAWSLDVACFSCWIMFAQDWRGGLSVLMRHLDGLAGFYMVQAYCRNDRDFLQFAWVMALAGIFPMATGVFEGITGIHWRITLGEDDVIRNIGLYHDAITIRYLALQTILSLLLIVAIGKRSRIVSVLCLGYAIAAAFVLKGAYSKSGFLTLGSWMLLWPLLRKKYIAFAGLMLAVGFALLGYSDVIMNSGGFIFNEEIAAVQGKAQINQTFSGRWYIWEDMAEEWQTLGTASKLLGAGRVATGSHNDYLQVLFHGGVLGLSIYVALLCAVGWSIAKILWIRSDIWAIAALFTYIMWMVDTIGLVPSAYSGYQWFTWGVIGYCLMRRKREGEQMETVPLEVAAPQFSNLMG